MDGGGDSSRFSGCGLIWLTGRKGGISGERQREGESEGERGKEREKEREREGETERGRKK